MDAAGWDARYAEQPLVWSAGPNALFADLTRDLSPGRALDVACGEGRNAIWLATRGWRVTGIDFSAVAIEKARQRSRADGVDVDVEWVIGDVRADDIGDAYDLTAVLYLHLPSEETRGALTAAARSVAPGGTLLVLGHDVENIERGVGGPQDRDRLYSTQLLADCAAGLTIERCEQVIRHVEDQGDAIDALLIATAPS